MPSKNILKTYVKDSYYHIYNRGVAKRKIFKSPQDYSIFLSYIKESLTKPKSKRITRYVQGRTLYVLDRMPKNFEKEIALLSYCLMPNHFHFLIHQQTEDSMKNFMRSICTRYVAYFNKKYHRVGPLFQGRYKARLVTDDGYLLHLSRYIHLNPSDNFKDLSKAYSSYQDYIEIRKASWVKTNKILKFFNNNTILEIKKFNSYKSFVEGFKQNNSEILEEMSME